MRETGKWERSIKMSEEARKDMAGNSHSISQHVPLCISDYSWNAFAGTFLHIVTSLPNSMFPIFIQHFIWALFHSYFKRLVRFAVREAIWKKFVRPLYDKPFCLLDHLLNRLQMIRIQLCALLLPICSMSVLITVYTSRGSVQVCFYDLNNIRVFIVFDLGYYFDGRVSTTTLATIQRNGSLATVKCSWAFLTRRRHLERKDLRPVIFPCLSFIFLYIY